MSATRKRFIAGAVCPPLSGLPRYTQKCGEKIKWILWNALNVVISKGKQTVRLVHLCVKMNRSHRDLYTTIIVGF